jgi:hypothetical protein
LRDLTGGKSDTVPINRYYFEDIPPTGTYFWTFIQSPAVKEIFPTQYKIPGFKRDCLARFKRRQKWCGRYRFALRVSLPLDPTYERLFSSQLSKRLRYRYMCDYPASRATSNKY